MLVSGPFWNRFDLKPPTVTSYTLLTTNPRSISMGLAMEFEKAITILENQNSLHMESALLSRILYRFKKKFRKDKGFKALEKVNKSLRHYLALDLLSTLTILRRSTYENKGPSCSMLEWGLTQIMGFASLFDRVYSTCLDAASHMNVRIKIGHSWDVAMICTGILSRIWTISVFLLLSSVEWYERLFSYLPHLQCDVEWLPAGYKLPEDLRNWLGNSSYLKIKPETVNVTDMNDVLSEVRKEETIRVSCVNDGLLFNEDLGEVLSRDHFNAETKKDSADCDFIKKIVSPIKLASFVKRESRLRKSDLDSAITRRLDSKRWKELRTYIANNLTKLSKLKDSDAVNILLKTVKEKVEKMIMPS